MNNHNIYYIYNENTLIHFHEIYINNKRYLHSLRPNELNNKDKLNNLPENLNKSEIIESESNLYIFLFDIDKACGGNYFHFCFHIMQKLCGYLILQENHPEMKIIIRDDLREFQKELILKFVKEEDIIFLNVRKNWYKVNHCYIGNYLDISSFPNFLLEKYQDLANEIYNYNSIEYINTVFIGRNSSNNAGNDRYIINNEDYYYYLNDNNILITNLDNKTIPNKIECIMSLHPKIIIIETGSGLINLFFIPKSILKNIRFIILNPSLWKIKESRIYNIFIKLDIVPYIVNCRSVKKFENKDEINNPFIINIEKLNETLDLLS
jgi:capsular polysaccharide biosynthesis protein